MHLRPLPGLPGACLLLVAATAAAQGPGSCGIHLDVLASDTSTHAAIADVPGAPGSAAGLAPGAPGNPYSARARPFSPLTVRLTVAPSTLGPNPFGAGSIISLFWAIGAPNIPLAAPANSIPSCGGGPWIVSVLPFGGALADGLGVLGAPPVFPPVDPGHPFKAEWTLTYPFVSAPPVTLQAAILTPTGQLAISNGVSILSGTNPNETSLLASMVNFVTCPFAPIPPTDEGGATITTPAGFRFYGTPVASGFAAGNGYIALGPVANQECDWIPGGGGLGCVPTGTSTSPRIAVNFFDANIGVPVSPALANDLTVETVPADATTPSRTIVRWKRAAPWYAVANDPFAEWASSVCELWGSDVPSGSAAAASSIVVVRQEHHATVNDAVYGYLGIGPGDFGQGFGGPASNCVFIGVWPSWGALPYAGAPLEALQLEFYGANNASDSIRLGNLATVFAPAGMGAYTVKAY